MSPFAVLILFCAIPMLTHRSALGCADCFDDKPQYVRLDDVLLPSKESAAPKKGNRCAGLEREKCYRVSRKSGGSACYWGTADVAITSWDSELELEKGMFWNRNRDNSEPEVVKCRPFVPQTIASAFKRVGGIPRSGSAQVPSLRAPRDHIASALKRVGGHSQFLGWPNLVADE